MKRFFRKAAAAFLIAAAVPSMLNAADVPGSNSSPPPIRKDLLLSFTGDMMAHIINYSMPDYSVIYRDIERIMLNDSLTFCNIEFPVNPDLPQASYPVFNIHPAYVKAAIDAGVDVMSLANNHTADQGTGGLIATVESALNMQSEYLSAGRRIYFSGAKSNPDTPFRPVTIYRDGWKIGYAAVSQFSNVEPEPGHMLLVDFRDENETEEFAGWVREYSSEYDLFILAYHGGVEYMFEPAEGKTALFKKLADAGADIIWGHHPHVIQPVEIVARPDGRQSVLMYSLGNFISGQGRIADPDLPEEEWSYTGDSAIIQVSLSWKDGGPLIEDVSAIPTANVINTNREVVITPLEELTHQPVPEPWMNFFLQRYILMHDYFNRNIIFPSQQ